MINTKNLLLAAAVAGLVAGTSIAKAEDAPAAGDAAPHAEEGAAPKTHKKGKGKGKGHAGKGGHKNACSGKNGCKGMDKGAAEAPAEHVEGGETK